MMGATMTDETVLRPGVHDRLIQDIDAVASMSRVPVSMIKTSSGGILGAETTAYLTVFRKLRAGGTSDAYLMAPMTHSPEKVMMAMAAALIRNFIDARIYPLQTVLEDASDISEPTVVLIPNFQNTFVGKPLASHQLQRLYSILLDRAVQDKATLVYIENLEQMATQYGTAITEFIDKNYRRLKE